MVRISVITPNELPEKNQENISALETLLVGSTLGTFGVLRWMVLDER